MKVKLERAKLNFSGLATLKSNPEGCSSLFKCNLANPKTLSPLLPNYKFTLSNSLLIA